MFGMFRSHVSFRNFISHNTTIYTGSFTNTDAFVTMNPNNETGGDDEFANGNLCPICLQSLFVEPEQTEPSTSSSSSIVGACIPCGHCFHSSCFSLWMSGCSDNNACKDPTCPLCKRSTAHFLDLKDRALTTKGEIVNDNEESKSVDSLQRVTNAQLSQYTIGAYIPCGHCFFYDKRQWRNKSWDETVATSSSQHELVYLIGGQFTYCESCNSLATSFLKMYIEPSKGLLTIILRHPVDAPLDGPSTVCSIVPTKGPSRIIVSNAGVAAVNGEYFYVGEQYNANRYVRSGKWNNLFSEFNICVWPYLDGSSQKLAWFISIGLKNDVGVFTDIDFYFVKITESPHNHVPPGDGWTCKNDLYADDCDGKLAGGPPTLSFDYSSTMFLKPKSGNETWSKIVLRSSG